MRRMITIRARLIHTMDSREITTRAGLIYTDAGEITMRAGLIHTMDGREITTRAGLIYTDAGEITIRVGRIHTIARVDIRYILYQSPLPWLL